MTINGQTLTLKLSLTSPSLITQSDTGLRTALWISKLFKIEGAGQIDFCGYQLLLLTQSENMIGKRRPSPLHLWVSACSSLFLMGCWWAAGPDCRDRSCGSKSWNCGKGFFKITNRMQTSCCFPEVSEFGLVCRLAGALIFHALALMCIYICGKDMWFTFSLAGPHHHIAPHVRDSLFSIIYVSHLSCPLPPSHFLHLWLPRQRGQGSQEAVTLLTQTQSHRCQRGDWFSFPASFSLPLFSAVALSLFSPSLSLSSTDLWDQLSKTDSGFFTDHECGSSYVMEAEIKRQKWGEQVNM